MRANDVKIESLLNHIADQCNKKQFWNALHAANDLSVELMSQFNIILKNWADTQQKEGEGSD